MLRNVLLTVLVLVFFALVALYISKTYEYYDEQVQVGWSDDARQTRYLALSKLLKAQGASVKTETRFNQYTELNDIDVLILPYPIGIPQESEKQRLIDWVHRGGHLLAGGANVNEDDILARLGFSSESVYGGDEEDDDESEISLSERLRQENDAMQTSPRKEESAEIVCMAPTSECDVFTSPEVESSELSQISFSDTAELYFYADDFYSLDHADFFEESQAYWTGTKNRITFAQVPIGQGYVSVITDFSIFDNYSLGHFDHAYILFKLVQDEKSIVLVSDWNAPSLSELLRKHFALSLLSLFVLIAVAIYHYSRRFGPTYDAAVASRRAQTERMQARSQFYWLDKNDEALVGILRNELEERLCKLVSKFEKLSAEEKAEAIAERTNEAPETIFEAFNTKLTYHEEQFTRVVATLQRLRTKI